MPRPYITAPDVLHHRYVKIIILFSHGGVAKKKKVIDTILKGPGQTPPPPPPPPPLPQFSTTPLKTITQSTIDRTSINNKNEIVYKLIVFRSKNSSFSFFAVSSLPKIPIYSSLLIANLFICPLKLAGKNVLSAMV